MGKSTAEYLPVMGNEKVLRWQQVLRIRAILTGENIKNYMGFRHIEYHLRIGGITLLGKKING